MPWLISRGVSVILVENHSWPRQSRAVGRFSKSTVSMRVMRALAVLLTWLNFLPKLNWAIFTFSMSSVSERPLKGGSPQSRMYRITPQLQISHFSLYLLKSTSGAM